MNKKAFIECLVNDFKLVIEAYIVFDLAEDIIIGANTIEAYNMIINYRTKIIELTNPEDQQVIETTFNEEDSNDNKNVKSSHQIKVEIIPDYLQEHFSLIIEQSDFKIREEKEGLMDLLKKYYEIFLDTPGICNQYVHTLILREEFKGKFFKSQYYPIPEKYIRTAQEQIETLLREGVIEHAQTPYISPLCLVKKKNGDMRVCYDGREINKWLVPEYCQVENSEILFQKIKGKRIKSTIDLRSSFHQIKLDENSKKYTGFMFQGESYQYCNMPFGLQSSMSGLIKVVNKVLKEVYENTAIFVDDVLIFSKDEREHLNDLEKVFKCIQKAGMRLNYKKCTIGKLRINFIGYVFDNISILPDPNKIESIKNFKTPTTRRQLKSFIAVCSFNRMFIKNFSLEISKLLPLTSTKTKFVWTDKETVIFNEIKDKFVKHCILSHPNENLEFIIQTDASYSAVAGILFQEDDQENKNIISCVSHAFTSTEKNWCSFEKELFAVYFSLKRLRNYVSGRKITVITDCKALLYMSTKKGLNPKITRWLLEIANYDITIKHIPGKENALVDYLSREGYKCKQEESEIRIMHTKVGKIYMKLIKEMMENVNKKIIDDPEYLKRAIGNMQYERDDQGLVIVINKKGEKFILMDKEDVEKISHRIHEEFMHIGLDKMYSLIKKEFYCKRMRSIIKRSIKSCDLCQKIKHATQTLKAATKSIILNKENIMISTDILGPLPTGQFNNKYIMVVQDMYSKFTKLFPLKRTTGREVISKLKKYWEIVGKEVKYLMSDNATYYRGHVFEEGLSEMKIIHHLQPVYYPNINSCERTNKEILVHLRSVCYNNQKKWVQFVMLVEDILNLTPNRDLGKCPQEIQFKETISRPWHKFIPEEVIKKLNPDTMHFEISQMLSKRQRKQERKNLNRKITELKVNEEVLIKSHLKSSLDKKFSSKLGQIYIGPYIINDRKGDSLYLLSDPKTNESIGLYHISNLKKYFR